MSDTLQKEVKFPVSHMAENLIGSEIIKLGNEVNERIKNGEKVFNNMVGSVETKSTGHQFLCTMGL